MEKPQNEVYYLSNSTTSLAYTKEQWKTKERHDDSGYGVRVLHDKRLGFSYCQSESDLKKAVENAASLARFSVSSNFSFQDARGQAKMKIFDSKLAEMQPDEMRSMLEQFRDGCKGVEQVRMYFNANSQGIKLENPLIKKQYEKTSWSLYAEATAGDGFGFAYKHDMAKPKLDWHEAGNALAEMAIAMKNPGKPATGTYDIAMQPEALHSILEIIMPSFSGDRKRRGISMLQDKQGKQAFSKELSLYDDATATASDCKPFDDEGTASRRICLVEKGVVKNFLYDRETAALEGVRLDANCSRDDYDSLRMALASNWVVPKGDCKQLSETSKEFIDIVSLHGTHTANTTTGDFGAEVSIAFHVKSGARKPLRGFMLTGNVFKLLNSIKAIESTQLRYGNMLAPRILFENAQVVS